MPVTANQTTECEASGWSRLEWAGRVLISALIVLPLFVCIWFVNAYSVNVPVYDQWHCVDILYRLQHGNLNWLDMFLENHGRHMCGTQLLVMAALAPLTAYNTRVEAFVGIAVMVAGWLALAQMTRERMPKGIVRLAALIPLSWLVFSVRHNESILGGVFGGYGAITVAALFVITIFLLEKVESINKTLLLAMVTGTLCAFTLFDGLLVMPFGFVQLAANALMLKGSARIKAWRAVAAWCVFSVFLAWAHFSNNAPMETGMGGFIWRNPWESVQQVLALVGSPLSQLGDGRDALLAGGLIMVLLAVFAIFAIRKPEILQRQMVAPAVFVVYSLLVGVLITAARAHNGLGNASTSRYVSHCFLGIVGVYLLFLSARKLSPIARRALVGALLVLIGGGMVLATADGFKCGRLRRDQHLIEANVLRTFRLRKESQALRKYAAIPARRTNKLAPFLEENRWSVFREGMPAEAWDPSPSPLVHFDGLDNFPGRYADGKYTFTISGEKDRDIFLKGWAVDRQSRGPVGGIIACLDDSLEIPMAYGLDRPDAAEALGRRSYRDSGFCTSFGTAIIGKGAHTISFKVLSPDKRGYYKVPPMVVLNGTAGL